MEIPHTPDRSDEVIPDEWGTDDEDLNEYAQVYTDWLNGEATKAEVRKAKRRS